MTLTQNFLSFNNLFDFNSRMKFPQSPGDFEQFHQEGDLEIPETPGEITATNKNNPGTMLVVDGGEDIAWLNPNNAKLSNNTYVTATTAGTPFQTIQSLKATNFSFAVPTGATINGIEVEIERKGDFNNEMRDKDVKLVIGDAVVGDQATVKEYQVTERYDVLGSSSDLWGNTISVAQVNAADFGVNIQAEVFDGGGNNVFSIDHIRIRVHYST